MKRIYMDHNATTPVHPQVLESMLPYFSEKFGNASTIYSFGREAKESMEQARAQVASLLGASTKEEVVFTSGGTESDNMAIKGVAFARADKGHIITSKIEHHAVLRTCQYLEKLGWKVTYLPVDSYGVVDIDELRKTLTPETFLVSVMHANSEVGSLQPIKEISKITRERGILLHTDAVQTFGKIPYTVDEIGVDLVSLSAHKIYGPKGVGALYIRKGTKMIPTNHGGEQERRRRGGTENVSGIVGFGRAAELRSKEIFDEGERLGRLRNKLQDGLASRIKYVKINGHPANRLPATLNMSFEFVEGESLILNLDMKGICVSSGSACTSGSLEPSHVLLAMGIPHEIAHGSLRFSLGRGTTEEDVDYVFSVLPEIVERLRAMSPLYTKK